MDTRKFHEGKMYESRQRSGNQDLAMTNSAADG